MKKIIIIFFFILIFTSCSPFKIVGIQKQSESCLPFLFPQGYNDNNEGYQTVEDDAPLEPSGPWQRIELSSSLNDNNGNWTYTLEFFVRGENENFLILRRNSETLVVFDIKKKELLPNETDVSFLSVLEDSEGEIWLQETLWEDNKIRLIKLNAISGDIKGSTQFFTPLPDDAFSSHALSLGNDIGWLIYRNNDDALLYRSFSKTTDSIETINGSLLFDGSIPGLDSSWNNSRILGVVADSNDNAFVGLVNVSGRIAVIKIVPDGEKSYAMSFDSLKLRIDMEWFSPKFHFDNKNRLWIGDYGWVNLGGNKDDTFPMGATIYRSPVFLSADATGAGSKVWDRPVPTADTSDGRIWFKSVRGTAWYQPKTGEWCMFSTSRSPILKDADGNLWMTYDNALYMLPASETQAKED